MTVNEGPPVTAQVKARVVFITNMSTGVQWAGDASEQLHARLFKGIVHPKIQKNLSFTYHSLVTKIFEFLHLLNTKDNVLKNVENL